jgi:hypothetical protein
MKKLFLTMGLVALTTIGWGQETIKRSDLYQDPTTYLLSQFIIEVEGKTTSELKNSVELWSTDMFNNPDHVTIAEGENYIVYKPLLTYYYDIGLGMSSESKITTNIKFEFKDGSIRVTISELESTYITQQGVFDMVTWPLYIGRQEVPSEIQNKGMQKANYRRYVTAIQERDKIINSIKNINFSPGNSSW